MRLNNKELVSSLIKGSREIDRMKQEIKLVVNLICGLVTAEQLRAAGFSFGELTISSTWGTWKLSGSWNKPGAGVLAMFHSSDANCRTAFGFASGSSNGDNMPLHNVLNVHRSLPTFVSEMVKTFPHLEERIQPLLDAAENS